MKKTIILLILFAIVSPVTIHAANTTPSPSVIPTSESVTEKLSNQINDLKEKIASRVAQLKLVEKRGIVGTVKDVKSTQLSISGSNGEEREVDVDEITKFSSSSSKDSFGISDIKPGMKISVIGLYNKDSQRILARFISSYTVPVYLSGMINTVDKENYTISVAMEEGKSYTVDIENITKTFLFSKDTTSEKAGFSKIEAGSRAIIIGYADKKEANRMIATRVLLFPALPKNPKVIIAPNAINPKESVPSSGSGKKLTPIIK